MPEIEYFSPIDCDAIALQQQAIQAELQHVMEFGMRWADRLDRFSEVRTE